jgi:hypothetical protein
VEGEQEGRGRGGGRSEERIVPLQGYDQAKECLNWKGSKSVLFSPYREKGREKRERGRDGEEWREHRYSIKNLENREKSRTTKQVRKHS